jgi:hypothetical protein
MSLKRILHSKFPDATIAIIRGYDNFSYEPYTQGAFFDEELAEKVMAKIPPNGTLADTYHVVTGTIKDLEQ